MSIYGESTYNAHAHIMVEALCDAPPPRRAGALALLVKADLHGDLLREDDGTADAAQIDRNTP